MCTTPISLCGATWSGSCKKAAFSEAVRNAERNYTVFKHWTELPTSDVQTSHVTITNDNKWNNNNNDNNSKIQGRN